jgi:hypothetical protein
MNQTQTFDFDKVEEPKYTFDVMKIMKIAKSVAWSFREYRDDVEGEILLHAVKINGMSSAIAKNVAISYVRKMNKKSFGQEAITFENEPVTPESDIVEVIETQRKIENAAGIHSELAEELAEIGSQKRLAKKMGLPLGRVKRLLKREANNIATQMRY